jgi:ERCC4-type nuclease
MEIVSIARESINDFKSSILSGAHTNQGSKMSNHMKREQWSTFINYMKEKPDKLL